MKMAMTQKKQRFLFERLEQVRSSKPSRWDGPKLPETDAVKAAKKRIKHDTEIVRAHDKRASEVAKKRSDDISDTVMVIKGAILFGDADKALKMIEAFSKKKF
jgi:hypothetical protein